MSNYLHLFADLLSHTLDYSKLLIITTSNLDILTIRATKQSL